MSDMPELTPEAFGFWREVYVAAVQGGSDTPKAVADAAVDHYVERLSATRAMHRLAGVSMLTSVIAEISAGQKIGAIKNLRALIPGMGFKVAKEAVEHYMAYKVWPQTVATVIDMHTQTLYADAGGSVGVTG